MASSTNQNTLFTVQIQRDGDHGGGSITCTEPAPAVYLLTFVSPPDNRLTTTFCAALTAALDRIEFGGYPVGVVVTTSGIQKFYSNGLDLNHAVSTPGYWGNTLYALWKRFLTFPMPTVALVNGHAFAGGFMTAMYHDYRVMNPTRGFCCLNELEFGAPLKPPMTSIFRQKASPAAYRAIVLEAKRLSGPDALAQHLVDALGGLDAVLELVAARKLVDKGKTGVYGLLRREMYRETIGYLECHDAEEERHEGIVEAERRRVEQGKATVHDSAHATEKSKL